MGLPPCPAVTPWTPYQQHLDNLRRKDSLRGVETTEISVHLSKYSASHFEGSAWNVDEEVYRPIRRTKSPKTELLNRATRHWYTELPA